MDGVIDRTEAEVQKKKVRAEVRGDAVSSKKCRVRSEDADRAAAKPDRVLVQDGAVPDGFETIFLDLDWLLADGTDIGAERDDVDAALCLYALSKTKKKISVEEKSAKDQFYLAVQTAPRKFPARFSKKLYSKQSDR